MFDSNAVDGAGQNDNLGRTIGAQPEDVFGPASAAGAEVVDPIRTRRQNALTGAGAVAIIRP